MNLYKISNNNAASVGYLGIASGISFKTACTTGKPSFKTREIICSMASIQYLI